LSDDWSDFGRFQKDLEEQVGDTHYMNTSQKWPATRKDIIISLYNDSPYIHYIIFRLGKDISPSSHVEIGREIAQHGRG
jgi:hypothetical protein